MFIIYRVFEVEETYSKLEKIQLKKKKSAKGISTKKKEISTTMHTVTNRDNLHCISFFGWDLSHHSLPHGFDQTESESSTQRPRTWTGDWLNWLLHKAAPESILCRQHCPCTSILQYKLPLCPLSLGFVVSFYNLIIVMIVQAPSHPSLPFSFVG